MNTTKHIDRFNAADAYGNIRILDVYQDFISVVTTGGYDNVPEMKQIREGMNHVNVLDGDKCSEFLVVETNTKLTRI